MSDQEKVERILDFLRPLSETSKDKPTPQRLLFTAQVLSDFEEEDIKNAIRIIAQRTVFFPAPAEIISIFKHDKKDEGEDWWNLILTRVKEKGFYAGPPEDLPTRARKAMENLGGWEGLCGMDIEKIPIYAKQFREAYRAFSNLEDVERVRIAPAKVTNLISGIGKKIDE